MKSALDVDNILIFPPQDPAQVSQCPRRVLCTMVATILHHYNACHLSMHIGSQTNAYLRCPACVNLNPQLERLQAATKNIPLKVVKVSDFQTLGQGILIQR